MIDPDPFDSPATQVVSNVKMTLQAMYKLQVEPSVVKRYDIKSDTTFTEVYPEPIDVEDLPMPEPDAKNQEPVV